MRPGFMSSVQPTMNLRELIDTAKGYGYEGLDFRAEWDHQHGIELDATDAFLAEARQMLEDSGIVAACIATTVKFNMPDREAHLPQREDLRRYIELSAKMGVPYIRTFSDSVPEDDEAARNKILSLAAESYASVDDWAKEHGVIVLVETHTNMYGHWAKQILDEAQADNLQVLWHAGHHVSRGVSVAETYPHIRGHVRHLHWDASRTEVVTDDENQRSFDLLAADGFTGFFAVENIDPENPDEVLQANVDKFRQYMGNIS